MPEWLLVILLVLGGTLTCVFLLSLLVSVVYMPPILHILDTLPVYPHVTDKEMTEGEAVQFRTGDDVRLSGRYVPVRTGPRQGVVIFSHEFGAGADSAARYAAFLPERGFDVFTFDYRGHGRSPNGTKYKPRQWATDKELIDLEAAIDYVMSRPDAPAEGLGVMGISRGAGTAISAAARDKRIKAVVTDGAFAPRTTILTYIKKWAAIYVIIKPIGRRLPLWFCRLIYEWMTLYTRRHFGWTLPVVERDIRRLAPRPILMIHGAKDTYIPATLSRRLFNQARQPKEHWTVPGAKHNQSYLAGQPEYTDRVTALFAEALAPDGRADSVTRDPETQRQAAAGAG